MANFEGANGLDRITIPTFIKNHPVLVKMRSPTAFSDGPFVRYEVEVEVEVETIYLVINPNFTIYSRYKAKK